MITKRVVDRFTLLEEAEVTDLFSTVQRIARVIETEYQATALTLAIQDGRDAGQSIAHVHVHILPRRPQDWLSNDQVYEDLNKQSKEEAFHLDNHARLPRNESEMAEEAQRLSSLFTTTAA